MYFKVPPVMKCSVVLLSLLFFVASLQRVHGRLTALPHHSLLAPVNPCGSQCMFGHSPSWVIPSCHLSCHGFQVPCCCTFVAPFLFSWIIGESFHPVSSHCITGSQMTAKVVFQKHKLNIIFHCLQDWVKTSEFNTDHALFGCCFLFPISTPHPVF